MHAKFDPDSRGWLLNLHLYGGLAACAYLLIYGVSSLVFNHPGLIPEIKGKTRSWEKALILSGARDDQALAEAIRDALGLAGWVPPWEFRRDDQQELHFLITHPGRDYRVHWDASDRKARVQEQSKGLRSVVLSLHGMSEGIPNAPFLKGWWVYTELTTLFVLFAVCSGVWLWAQRARERGFVWGVLMLALTGSLGFMAYLYWRG